MSLNKHKNFEKLGAEWFIQNSSASQPLFVNKLTNAVYMSMNVNHKYTTLTLTAESLKNTKDESTKFVIPVLDYTVYTLLERNQFADISAEYSKGSRILPQNESVWYPYVEFLRIPCFSNLHRRGGLDACWVERSCISEFQEDEYSSFLMTSAYDTACLLSGIVNNIKKPKMPIVTQLTMIVGQIAKVSHALYEANVTEEEITNAFEQMLITANKGAIH